MSGKARADLITAEKTFGSTAARFTLEYGMITDGQRAQKWTKGHVILIRRKVMPDLVVYSDSCDAYRALDVSEFNHFRIDYSNEYISRHNINGVLLN